MPHHMKDGTPIAVPSPSAAENNNPNLEGRARRQVRKTRKLTVMFRLSK